VNIHQQCALRADGFFAGCGQAAVVWCWRATPCGHGCPERHARWRRVQDRFGLLWCV